VQPLMGWLSGAPLDDACASSSFVAAIYLVTSGGRADVIDTWRENSRCGSSSSGPAGGAIFAPQVADGRTKKRVLSFDMGGTTAKICLDREFRTRTALARPTKSIRAARFLKAQASLAHSGDRDGGDRLTVRLDRAYRRTQARYGWPRERELGAGHACYGRGACGRP